MQRLFDARYTLSYLCRMSIKIVIQASGLNVSANLRDDALAVILQLIQEKRDDSTPSPPVSINPARAGIAASVEALSEDQSEDSVKATLNSRGGAELLNQMRWDSFPEKILLLGAWHEARGGTTPWRSSDMEEAFKMAKETRPSNFPRDIKNAIKSGWIHNETPRTYVVTRTGWNKIGYAIGNSPQ
jgi:hypothetical protein